MMFATEDFPLKSGSTGSGMRIGFSSGSGFSYLDDRMGTRFRGNGRLLRSPSCSGHLQRRLICVCVTDMHQGPTSKQTSRLLLGCGALTPQPWTHFQLGLEAQPCWFLPWPLWEQACRGGRQASPRHQLTCTAWAGLGSWSQRMLHLPDFPEPHITNAQARSTHT